MIEFSDTTQRRYETEEAVFYRNVLQAAFMISKPDCILLDIFTDGKGKIVFVFPKELHRKYIEEWANRPH
jgi:hypothetical protein